MNHARAHVVVLARRAGGTGSVSLVTRHHARELAREFRVTIVSDSLPDGIDGVLVKPREFNMLRRFAHVPNEIAFACAARKALFAIADVDFVLCEGDVPAAIAARALKRKRGTPYGIVTHGDMATRPKGTFDPRLSALYRWAEKRSARDADLVVAIGSTMAALARRRGARDDAITIVPHGIDPEEIGIDATGERADTPSIELVFVGRLALEKGVLPLIDAAHILHDRGVAFQLMLVGGGPLDAAVRDRARGLNVTLLGQQPRPSLGAHFQRADVAIVPSLNEPFGLVLIEALASGTPVIASNVDDIPNIVRHDENGLLVPAGDAEALANAIELLARDRERLRRLRERARPSVLPRFSWDESGRLLRDAVRARLRHNR